MTNSLSSKIRRARRESKMSQKELGDALGISDKAISSYEQARATPPLQTLQKIAKLTHKPINYFTSSEESDLEFSIASLLSNIERDLKEVKKLLTPK